MSRTGALSSEAWAAWANVAVTALTFAIALVLFVIGLRDRRRADDDRLRDQARKVWIWRTGLLHEIPVREDPRFRFGAAPPSKPTRLVEVGWELYNDSDDPITQCRCFVARDSDSMPEESSQLPAAEPLERVNPREPGEEPTSGKVIGFWSEERPPLVLLYFYDAAGVRWLRDSAGNLDLVERPRRGTRRQEPGPRIIELQNFLSSDDVGEPPPPRAQ
jgi:hypothetical protein